MANTGQAAQTATLRIEVPSVATAGNSAAAAIGKVPFDGTITRVQVLTTAALNGQATNTRLHRVVNKGQAGAGAVVPASLQYNAGVNIAAYTPKDLPLSATPSDLAVAKDDVLAFESNAVGTGIVDPGANVTVEVTIARAQ